MNSPRRTILRVLVTGGAGFIGSHLCDRLLARGDAVVAFDNFDPFYDPKIKAYNIEVVMSNARFTLVEGDLRLAKDVARLFKLGPFDGIVHLAARAGVRPSLREPALYESVNVQGTINLLEAARSQGCGHFVLSSSSSVYGDSTPVPFQEDAACDRPASPYAATKRACEMMAYTFHHLYGLPVTCLRFFTVYGPRQRPEMAIHKFTRQLAKGQPVEFFGDGSSRRDYTYIDDIITGVVNAMDRPRDYRIYNLGTTDMTRLNELVAMIGDRLGLVPDVVHGPSQPGDVVETRADISLARAELDYCVTTGLADGLDRFVEWYLKAATMYPVR